MASDTFRVALAWGQGSNTPFALTTVHTKLSAPVDLTLVEAELIRDSIQTELVLLGPSAIQAAGFRWLGCRISETSVNPQSVALTAAGGSVNLGQDGGVTADLMPRGVAQVVTLRTPNLSRKGTGRVYVPAWNENANAANGGPSVAAQARALAFVEAIALGLAYRSGAQMAVYSRGADISYAPVTPVVRDGIWDRQWRRNYTQGIEV